MAVFVPSEQPSPVFRSPIPERSPWKGYIFQIGAMAKYAEDHGVRFCTVVPDKPNPTHTICQCRVALKQVKRFSQRVVGVTIDSDTRKTGLCCVECPRLRPSK